MSCHSDFAEGKIEQWKSTAGEHETRKTSHLNLLRGGLLLICPPVLDVCSPRKKLILCLRAIRIENEGALKLSGRGFMLAARLELPADVHACEGKLMIGPIDLFEHTIGLPKIDVHAGIIRPRLFGCLVLGYRTGRVV